MMSQAQEKIFGFNLEIKFDKKVRPA